MKKIIEYNSQENKRIDSFARDLHSYLPRSIILNLINSGAVLVNEKKVSKGYRLKIGDQVQFVSFPKPIEIKLKGNPKIPLKIIYEDNDILAIDKPRGIPTHPIIYNETGTLANAIVAKFPELRKVGEKKLECGLLQRLDNDTSGIILCAKNNIAFNNFKKLFEEKKIYKEYIALVIGHPQKDGVIHYPIVHDPKNKRKMKIADEVNKSKCKRIFFAETHYEVIKQFRDYSLLRVSLKTAVTHQIRVHLASIGHPIVGDMLYQGERYKKLDRTSLKEHFLHASLIKFRLPISGNVLKLSSSLPSKLRKLLERLPR